MIDGLVKEAEFTGKSTRHLEFVIGEWIHHRYSFLLTMGTHRWVGLIYYKMARSRSLQG
jgi:hypothetical protein